MVHLWLTLQLRHLLDCVLIENLQDAINVFEVAVFRIDVDWQPSQLLDVLKMGQSLAPPTLDNASRPEALIALLHLVEDGREHIEDHALSLA